jgi:hypothetical protein
MQLDGIALLLPIEKTFAINLPVEEYVSTKFETVGDLYRLVLQELDLDYQSRAEIDKLQRPFPSVIADSTDPAAFWNTAAVWRVLKSAVSIELHLDQSAIGESTPLRPFSV